VSKVRREGVASLRPDFPAPLVSLWTRLQRPPPTAASRVVTISVLLLLSATVEISIPILLTLDGGTVVLAKMAFCIRILEYYFSLPVDCHLVIAMISKALFIK
jgi:hypothetical protein